MTRNRWRRVTVVGRHFGWTWVVLGLACDTAGPPVIGVAARPNFVNAARLAVEDAIARGDAPTFDTIMIVESGNEPAIALASAASLVDTPGIVAVVGHSASGASVSASQVYNETRVVQIAPTSTAAIYSRAGPFSFRLVSADDRQGRFLADEVARSLPQGGRVAVLYVNDEYGRGLRAALLEGLAAYPTVSTALDLPHVEGGNTEREVRQIVDGLVTSSPDLMVWLGREPVLDLILPRLRAELGAAFPILGGDALSSAAEFETGDGRWTGIRYVEFLDLERGGTLRDVRARYRARFGREATGPEVLTYDAMSLLIEGIRQGVRTGPEMREFLVSLDRTRPPFEGITGTLRFDEEGNVERSYVIEVVGGGEEAE